MKIYGKSCRSALKTKPDEQPIYDPSTRVIEKYRHQAKRSQRENPNYRFEYIDRVHESLQDPNSKYHGTFTAAKLPPAKRCSCDKCREAVALYKARDRQQYYARKARRAVEERRAMNKRGQW